MKKFELPVLAGVKVETLAGVMVNAWPTLTIPRLFMRSGSMTVVGVGVLKSLVRLMREPVTVTSSRVVGALADGVAGAFWACTPEAKHNAMATLQDKPGFNEWERMAARKVAAMAERFAVIWAPSQENERVARPPHTVGASIVSTPDCALSRGDAYLTAP